MRIANWLKDLIRRSRPTRRALPNRMRLGMEVLEARAVPAAFQLATGLATNEFIEGENPDIWVVTSGTDGDNIPDSNDTILFHREDVWVEFSGNRTFAGLSFEDFAGNFQVGGDLTITGDVDVDADAEITVDGGDMDVQGGTTLSANTTYIVLPTSADYQTGQLHLDSGSVLICGGMVSVANGGSTTGASSCVIEAADGFTLTGGTFTCGNSTTQINDSAGGIMLLNIDSDASIVISAGKSLLTDMHVGVAGALNINDDSILRMTLSGDNNTLSVTTTGTLHFKDSASYQTGNGAALEVGDTHGGKHLIYSEGDIIVDGGETAKIWAGVKLHGSASELKINDHGTELEIKGHVTSHANDTSLYLASTFGNSAGKLTMYGGTKLDVSDGNLVADYSIITTLPGASSNTVTYEDSKSGGGIYLTNSVLNIGGGTSTSNGTNVFEMNSSAEAILFINQSQVAVTINYDTDAGTGGYQASCDKLVCKSLDDTGGTTTLVMSYINYPGVDFAFNNVKVIDCTGTTEEFDGYTLPPHSLGSGWHNNDYYVGRTMGGGWIAPE